MAPLPRKNSVAHSAKTSDSGPGWCDRYTRGIDAPTMNIGADGTEHR
jgi:hypothetical protein